jgi:hypothetical protein
MEKILCAPTPVLATVGPDHARQATPSQTDQRTECLSYSTLKGALLREHSAPILDNIQKSSQKTHRIS